MLNGSSLNSSALNSSSGEGELRFSGAVLSLEQIVTGTFSGNTLELEQLVGEIESGTVLELEQEVEGTFEGNSLVLEQLVGEIESGIILELEQDVGGTFSGLVLELEQNVGILNESEIVLTLEQEVIYANVASGTILTLEQAVQTTESGNILILEQKVIDEDQSIKLDTFGFDLDITLGGNAVPHNQIHGAVTWSRSENLTAQAEFTIIPTIGLQAPENYVGQSVTIDVTTPTLGIRRVFTGVVDIPEIDIIDKKISFRCVDRRTELINAQLPGKISSIGTYSSVIFSNTKDTAEELEQRLTTTPTSVDFDAHGNFTVTSWYAKASPDFTLNNSDIYYRDPNVEIVSRSNIVNSINIAFEYRYERLHHTFRNFRWTSPIANDVLKLLRDGYSMTSRSDVIEAINSARWPIQGTVTFTPIWPSGWYGSRAWSTVSFTGVTTYKKDVNGNVIVDSSGNPVVDTVQRSGTDFGPLYCMGATWKATTRWNQSINESYGLRVQSSQSVAQYGEIPADETYSLDNSTDNSEWENYNSYNDTGNGSDSYNIRRDTDRASFNSAVSCALNKAKTTILSAHRNTRVGFTSKLRPDIDLKHTVYINTDSLRAKGKVYAISGSLDISSGEALTNITLALFKANGSSNDSNFVAPAVNYPTVVYDTGTITLGNHFGENPDTEAAKAWNGFIGNRYPTNGLARTTYTEQFIVDVPAIPDALRQEYEISVGTNYNVSIPNDTLEVEF